MNRQQADNNEYVGVLICVGIAALSVGVLLYGTTFLSGKVSHEPFIATWSPDEVSDWFTTEFPPWGGRTGHEDETRVDGRRLLALNVDDLGDLGVENQYRQQTILHYVNHLKTGTAPRQPRSLTEFNEYYFRDTLLTVNLYAAGHPNVAIWILYFTNYNHAFLPFFTAAMSTRSPVEGNTETTAGTSPVEAYKVERSPTPSWKQLFLFWLIMITLSPNVLVGKVALIWFLESPIMASVVIVHCCLHFCWQHLKIWSVGQEHGGRAVLVYVVQYYLITPAIHTAVFYTVFAVTWKILPTFLWTVTYYIMLANVLVPLANVYQLWQGIQGSV